MKERNFGKNLIMMMTVLILIVLFCSCNAAGVAAIAYEDTTSTSSPDNNGSGYGPFSLNIIFPEDMSIAVAADGDKVRDGQFITIEAGKSLELAMETTIAADQYTWYVGASIESDGSKFTFGTAQPGVYSVMAAAYNKTAKTADSLNFTIIVK